MTKVGEYYGKGVCLKLNSSPFQPSANTAIIATHVISSNSLSSMPGFKQSDRQQEQVKQRQNKKLDATCSIICFD